MKFFFNIKDNIKNNIKDNIKKFNINNIIII